MTASPLVHESLSTSARAHAERSALVGTSTVTYAALDEGATAIARCLREARTVVGDRVAIWMPKSQAHAFAIFGALRAGCAYVPLDGGQPVARARVILDDAEPVALVTDAARLAILRQSGMPRSIREVIVVDGPTDSSIEGLRIRSLRDVLAWKGDQELPHMTPSELAAILYTSGSTGVPKGVQISHLNLATFIAWAHHEMQLGPNDVFSNHASFNFDLSTFDLFAAARAGAALWIVPDAAMRNVTALAEGLERHGVTVVYAVPSIFTLLVSSGMLAAIVSRFRYVLFAGEVYPIARLRELMALLTKETALYNLYGPTETNVCTYYRVTDVADDRLTAVPIGRPIDGAFVSVVDDEGRPLADPAIVGELVVEGSCVTPGYFRRVDERNGALHRRNAHATGDLVSWENGELVYRGRKDRMLKIAGHRVELGEIEAALGSHPAIAEVGVVARGEGADTRLLAFYALREGASEPSLVEVKTHCGKIVPRYMVPHLAVRLSALPKNANGKIDYPALARKTGELAPAPLASSFDHIV